MNENSFEDLAQRFEDEDRAAWQKPELVIEKLGDIKGNKIGDIGAGTGYFSFRMVELGANVTAIDVDERFIDFIKDKIAKESTTNLETRLVGYDNPELSENEFDALIIVDTYHHFNDKIEYMTYCFKGLKVGGTFMNVDFKKKETAHGPSIDHRIAAEEVKKDLLEVGFTDVQIDQSTLTEQYIITARK
jgi:cyclopropane fatty-acyl-phospholipid synthase-like methyltransferase